MELQSPCRIYMLMVYPALNEATPPVAYSKLAAGAYRSMGLDITYGVVRFRLGKIAHQENKNSASETHQEGNVKPPLFTFP